MVAIAGAPASGKSTLAERLAETLEADAAGGAALIAMDGFHLDDEALERLGWRARKGAPHTFDVAGFASLLARLRDPDPAEPWIAAPRFDRDLEIARAGAVLVRPSVRTIVVEGNYLLLRTPPWTALARFFDMTALIETSAADRAARLRQRWSDHGVDADEAERRIAENDLPNGALVEAESRTPDVLIVSD